MIRLVGNNEPDIEEFELAGSYAGPGSYGNSSNAYTINHFRGKEVNHVQLRLGSSHLHWYNRNWNIVNTNGIRGFLVHSITLDSFTIQLYQEGSTYTLVKAYFY